MKKIKMSALAIIFAVSGANAQSSDIAIRNDVKTDKQEDAAVRKEKRVEKKELRKEDRDVSYQSKQQFYSDFGNVPVQQWSRTSYFDEATFLNDGQETKAYYDMESQLVGTTTHKSFDDLPASAQKYINNKYADYTKADVIFFDDNENNDMDMVLYGSRFDDSDMYFVELKRDNKDIILMVQANGNVSFFTQLG
jgi:hypothetical protein